MCPPAIRSCCSVPWLLWSRLTVDILQVCPDQSSDRPEFGPQFHGHRVSFQVDTADQHRSRVTILKSCEAGTELILCLLRASGQPEVYLSRRACAFSHILPCLQRHDHLMPTSLISFLVRMRAGISVNSRPGVVGTCLGRGQVDAVQRDCEKERAAGLPTTRSARSSRTVASWQSRMSAWPG
jgi:hypothetical protein